MFFDICQDGSRDLKDAAKKPLQFSTDVHCVLYGTVERQPARDLQTFTAGLKLRQKTFIVLLNDCKIIRVK